MTAYPLPAIAAPARRRARTGARVVRWLAAGALAVALWAVAPALAGQATPQPVPAGGFGSGYYPVRAIERAPQQPSSNRLERVRCAGAAGPVSSCWVSRP